ncbi:MAG TPA: hypothetical protein VK716_08325 [Terracidiphilus sp.]|jgi:hypothetical protein|nr:hypothetical protein [Terracidiphilus sp.]
MSSTLLKPERTVPADLPATRLPGLFDWTGSFRAKVQQPAIAFLVCCLLAVGAIAVMGYHPGIEDDALYLSAVKSDLNPSLYPHDAEFFRTQLQATILDKCVAGTARWTGMPVDVTVLLWQFASIALILFGAWSIARLLFAEAAAQWAGVAFLGAMLTLPVAGTALFIADQHLHPRNVATALLLLAVSRILANQRWQALPLLVIAFSVHPIMAALGISFCFFLALVMLNPAYARFHISRESLASATPLGWILEAPTPAWHKALATRSYFFLNQWAWYEWLGAVAPLFLFGLLWRIARRRGEHTLERFALAVMVYGAFQFAVAVFVLSTPALIRLTPMQPMRFLQLIYVFMVLIAGCLLGKWVLRARVWRWAVLFVATSAGMFMAQRELFAGTEHLELPGRRSTNEWLQAFAWIRQNTPQDAYFAMDPLYMAAPGEGYHGFRALAERSQLADNVKDPSVVAQVPELGPEWERQTDALQGWTNFGPADFKRLHYQFGVNWVLVKYPQPAGLSCAWHNAALSVCEIR